MLFLIINEIHLIVHSMIVRHCVVFNVVNLVAFGTIVILFECHACDAHAQPCKLSSIEYGKFSPNS